MKTQRINKILHVQKDMIGTQTPTKWFEAIRKLTSRKLRAISTHPYYYIHPEDCTNEQLLFITGGINSAKAEVYWDAGMVVILLHTTVKRKPRFSIANKQPQKPELTRKTNTQTTKQQPKTSPSKAGMASLWQQGHTIVSIHYQAITMSSFSAHWFWRQ